MNLRTTLVFALGAIASGACATARAQSELPTELIDGRLASLSAANEGRTIDCGRTNMSKPESGVTVCAKTAFEERKPFHALYSGVSGFFRFAYGLAGDADGNVYEVEYDSRGLLNLGLGKKAQAFDGNQIRVTTCLKPTRLGTTQEGVLACVTPVNEQESQRAAGQKPVETTICVILEHPSAFNNKMVRVHGYVSGNFEYSEFGADECSHSLWFAYGGGEGPPGLMAYISGGARPGSEDDEGKQILPIPVKLVQDLNFRRFEELMKARAEADDRSFKENADPLTLYRVAATFIGRIDAVSDDVHAFHSKRRDTDLADFLGFGQMGLFDAQFVLQSVENNAVLQKFPPIPNPR
jgi:hypothetical protein